MDIEDKLRSAELTVVERLVDASNATILCEIEPGIQVIYKPIAGERPLWDFPDGDLASREVAAYYISQIGKFHLVPLTILRSGPYGDGSVQLWIDSPEDFDAVELGQSDHPQLRQMALFDAVINNTDRKFGHLIVDAQGSIFGCDHGVTFHAEDKLRTVLWRWSGDSLSIQEIDQLEALRESIDDDYLSTLISLDEIAALRLRIERLLTEKRMPQPSDEWPAVPWPPY